MGEKECGTCFPREVGSSIEPDLDLFIRPNDFRHEAEPASLSIIGDGNGVTSDIVARYGDASTEPASGESEDAMGDAERLDRSEDAIAGMYDGDVLAWCSPKLFVDTGVSKMVGVSFSLGPLAWEGVDTFVLMYNPALAGVEGFDARCASAGWVIEVSSACSAAALWAIASSFTAGLASPAAAALKVP